MSNRVHRRENGGRNLDIEGQYSRNNGFEVEGQHSNNDGADSAERRMPRTILDPGRQFLQVYNKILLVSCVVAVSVDPLFFYIPFINDDKRCLAFDKRLMTTVLGLRTVTDVIYLVHIILQFRTAFASEEGGETKLNTNARAIIWRYLRYFPIDILVVLPIPQVAYGILLSDLSIIGSSEIIKLLNTVVLFQYVPRVRQIYLSWKELTKSPGKFVGWVKAAFNFFLYILSSHVMGAFWYFFSIQRETACWHTACKNDTPNSGCFESIFNCTNSRGDYPFLDVACPINTPNSTLFDFGIFLEALQSDVVEFTNLPQKFFYCFWWGLRNLSSFGQNLQTSNYVWENCFAIFISIFGLLLFLSFIENLKDYIQLDPKRLEGQSKKKKLAKPRKAKREIQAWIERHGFPDDIKHKIMQIVDEKLNEDIYVDVENLFLSLPQELKNDVNRHLYFDMLKKVPVLENLDELLLLMICNSLKPVSYDKCSYIVREGDPIDTTFFIMQGIAWSYTTNNNGEGTSSSHVECLEKGHFFGEELLSGLNVASPPCNPFRLPVSSKIVKSHTKVEALALMANDLKNIVEQLENDAAIRLQAA